MPWFYFSVDEIVDDLNRKIEQLEAEFDKSLTPNAILDLTSVNWIEGTADESRSSGILEVQIGGPDGIRGTVCDDGIDDFALNLFCQEMGYLRASNATQSLLSQGMPKINMY